MGSEITHTPFSLPISDILCQTSRMKNLAATLCLTLAVLLGNTGASFALSECKGSPLIITDLKEVSSSWSNCKGAVTFGSGGGK
jgi:hypothetical protein